MKTVNLQVSDDVSLVAPDIDRDAALAVGWLSGNAGQQTMLSMGNVPGEISQPSLEHERERIQAFIDNPDQLNWMIEVDGEVIGSVWVDLKPTEYVQAPAIHIMIGDPSVRGKGIGSRVFRVVFEHLAKQGHTKIYTRHLVKNTIAAKLLKKSGFAEDGPRYTDRNGLSWQNTYTDVPTLEK